MFLQAHRQRSFRKAGMLLAMAAAIVTSQAVALAYDRSNAFIAPGGRQITQETVTPFAVLTPQAGNELRFVDIADGAGVGVIEVLDPGVGSATGHELLRGANPLEIFNALSREDTDVPELLTELYGEPALGPQGWANPQLDKSPGSESTDVSFSFPEKHKTYPRKAGCLTRMGGHPKAWLAPLEYGLDAFSSFFLSSLTGPVTSPADWSYQNTPPSWNDGGPYYEFAGEAKSVTAFSTSVILCDTAFFYSINGDQVGKDVVLYTRQASETDSNVWLSIHALGPLDVIDKVISFSFHPADFESPLASRLDFRLEIQHASGAQSAAGPGTQGDRYYVGASWHEMTNDEFPAR